MRHADRIAGGILRALGIQEMGCDAFIFRTLHERFFLVQVHQSDVEWLNAP
jgi:hypothetical protein